MFNMGLPEIVIIMALALLLFGPKRLPEIGKSLGKTLRELRKVSDDFKDSISNEFTETKSEIERLNDDSDSNRNP